MRTVFAERRGLPYRTLAVCLTIFVIVANVSFWMFTDSQPNDEHQRLARQGSGSNPHRRSYLNSHRSFASAQKAGIEATVAVDTLIQQNRSKTKPLQTANNRPMSPQKLTTFEESQEGRNILIYPELLEAAPREISELEGRVIPNTVHYIWCGNATFEYRHYLSVMTVYTMLEPDAIEFRYEIPPREDKYNTWFTFVRSHLSMFQVSPLPGWVTGRQCGDSHGLETLSDRGGILVATDVLMGPAAAKELLYNNFTVAFKRDMRLGMAASTPKNKVLRLMIDSLPQSHTMQEAGSSLSHALKHVNTSKLGNEKLTRDMQIVDHIQSSYNESRIFYCTDTAVVKDIELALLLPSIPDEQYRSGRENGDFCVNVDNRLRPFHVIQGHKENPLVSLLSATLGLKPHGSTLVSLQAVQSNNSKSTEISNSSTLESAVSERLNNSHNRSKANHSPASNHDMAGMGVPRLIHYVWFGLQEMTFAMYLSFLSSVYVVKPDKILIHGDGRLRGKFWDQVKKNPLVTVVYRDPPIYIFSKAVVYTSHRSDVVRADVLDKYGGIYVDWDAYWLSSPEQYLASSALNIKANYTTKLDTTADKQQKSQILASNRLEEENIQLHKRLTEAGAVVSRDHIPRAPFPDTINMGVVLARPRSKFIRAWRAALVDYRSRDFLYNAVELPYKIYEMIPHSVIIDDRLQVMCYYLLCHPSYRPDFKHWNQAQPFNWTTDGVHAIHFTHPDPPAFHNLSSLVQASGMFADIGRFIWALQPEADKAAVTNFG